MNAMILDIKFERQKFGERQKGVLGRRSGAERRVSGGEEGKKNSVRP